MVAPTTKRRSRRLARWRMSKSPWKVYVLLTLMLISTVSSVRAGDLKNTGTIHNTGQVQVKNAAIGLPATNGGLYEFFGGNQTLPGRQYQDLKLSGTGTKTCDADATVTGTLTVVSGVTLDTGPWTVHLGGTMTEQGYVLGTMDKTLMLLGGSATSTVGNIGATISWVGVAPGNTTVLRKTGVALTSVGTGKQSIRRYYDITPAINSGLNATLVFKYVDSELNGQDPTTLILWRSLDGGLTWRKQGGTVDVVQRTITKTAIQSFSRWTASDAANPLGPSLIEGVPQNLVQMTGSGQTANVGTALSPFVVKVTDGFGTPVMGVPVDFAIASVPSGATGQGMSTTATVTDNSGKASTVLQLGNKAGAYTVSATSAGLVGSPVVFNATAQVPVIPPAATLFALTSGNNQSGEVYTSLSSPLVVTVRDQFNAPMGGVAVQFALASAPSGAAGQGITNTSVVTNASGQALTVLKLGTKAGNYVVTASCGSLSGSPVTFTAKALAGAAAAINLPLGNSLSGQVGQTLSQALLVVVTDAYGNPTSGVGVRYAITSSPAGAIGQTPQDTTIATDSQGQAQLFVKLGSKAGVYLVQVTVGSLPPQVITINAGVGSVAVSLAKVSGDNQSALVGTVLVQPLVVTLTDAYGNPVSGVSVDFVLASVPSGATGQALSTASAVTGANGQASTMLTLGSKAGVYVVTASSSGLPSVTFTATGTGTLPGAIATRMAQTSGNGQSGRIGTQLTEPFVVTVLDQYGSPFAGATVTFAITGVPAGGASAVLTATAVVTNASGQASTQLKLGTKAGVYTVTASSGGLTGSPVTFTATATATPGLIAFRLVMTTGNGQSGAVNAQLADPFVVTVLDSAGNPVSGTAVHFAFTTVPSGSTGQSLSDTLVTTDVNGQAMTQLKLGSKAGTYTVTASSGSLIGSPLVLTATATSTTPGIVAAKLLMTSGNSQSGTAGVQLAKAFVVTVVDTAGNPVSGTGVRFALAAVPTGSTGSAITDTAVVSGQNGEASTYLRLGTKVGQYTVTASSGSLAGSPVTFTTTATAGQPMLLAMVAGNLQSGAVRTTLPQPMTVSVADTFGNPVSGANIRFAFASVPTGAAGQSLSSQVTPTDALGQASTAVTIGNKPGEYRVEARTDAIPGRVVTFSINAVAGVARTLALASGQGQRGIILSTTAQPFVVRSSDADDNPVSNVSVQFAIVSAPAGATGQHLNVTTSVTDSLGNASALLTFGDVTGTYTVTASSSGLTGSPLTFNAVASLPSGAVSVAYTSGDGQSAPVLTQAANLLVATVTDADGRPVAGQTIAFALDSLPQNASGQMLNPTTAATDAQGRASTALTLGSKLGLYKVTASVAGLSGSPVEFRVRSTVGAPKSIAYIQGSNQTRQINNTLDTAFVVKVVDAGQNPVPGVAVQFAIDTVPSGAVGHSLRLINATTDAQGQATAILTLGSKVGSYVASATSSGLEGSPIRFSARATAGAPSVIAMTSGNEQTGYVSTELAAPFVVVVTDNGGNLVQGVNVQFAIETTPAGSRGHSLRIINSLTDAQGQASVVLMLGDQIGRYTVTATAAGLSTVRFGATATVLVGDINRDNSINIADLTSLIDHILGKLTLTGMDSVRADFNKDGRIDVIDVIMMQNYLLTIQSASKSSDLPGMQAATASLSPAMPLVDTTSAIKGEFVLTENGIRFNLTNSAPIKGLQLIVRFKDVQNIPSPDVIFDRARVDSFYLNSSGRDLRIVAYNLNNTPIAAGDGPLFRLPIKLSDVSAIEIGQIIVSKINNTLLFDEAVTNAINVRLAKPGELPISFVLYQNYPNPFNERTKIEYEVSDAQAFADVSVQVYNNLGQKVKTLVSGNQAGGQHSVTWDGTDDRGSKLSSGAYYYRLISGSYVSSKKMIMLK